jgi:phosphotransferase system enzyme I (PtsI)
MKVIEGLSIFEGIAHAHAFVIPDSGQKQIPKSAVVPQKAHEEWNRFLAACDKTKNELIANFNTARTDERLIFDTHRMMLEDTFFFDELHTKFEQSQLNIEFVLDEHIKNMAAMLRAAKDASLAERADDILDVFGKVQRELLNVASFDFSLIPRGTIVVARALSPSDALLLFRRRPAGLCLAQGGASGHLAILTRSARLPAVFAAENAHTLIATGANVIIDGLDAKIYIDPDAKTAGTYHARLLEQTKYNKMLLALKTTPCYTKDGKAITLLANIGTPQEARAALEEGAEGIGLFRTEFLFMESRELMAEDAQYEAYREVLTAMQDKPVTIRTLDLGGDKFINHAEQSGAADTHQNPLLGQRSIRLALAHPDVFKTQLRALYRASVHGNLKIMLPLIVDIAEVQASRALIAQVQEELEAQNIPFNKNVPIGIMIETPAAALATDLFAHTSDFFSIGTNDLTQYSLAVDRENAGVSLLYSEFHVSVLRLIKTIAQSARSTATPLSVCGEMAGTIEGATVLAGLGISTLSMTSASISKIKYSLLRFSRIDLQYIAHEAFAVSKNINTRAAVQTICHKFVHL